MDTYIIPFVRRTPTLAAATAQLRSSRRARIVLIHDPPAATETPGVADDGGDELIAETRDDRLTVLANRAPSGYVRSVNRAAMWALRNLDASYFWVVNDDVAFVRGLPTLNHLPSDAGLVGVLSNRAGFQSVTYSFDEIGDYLYPRRDVRADAVVYDALVTRTGQRLIPVPLVHGFCFGVSRQCLETIGLFDEHAFNLGYGSEYDLSLRATRAGFKNYVYAGAFVWHAGSASTGRVKRRIHSIRADAELRRMYGEDYKRAKFVTRQRLNRHLQNFVAFSRD